MLRKNDPLYNALNNSKRSSFSIPIAGRPSFTSKINMEHFGLTYSQRFLAFFCCLILGVLTFFYSLMNLIYVGIRPYKFAIPYAFSNLFFFTMIGFIKGFKSYFKDLNAPHKRLYTYTFVFTTFLTLYMASKTHYLFSMALMIMQVISFIAFAISFLPGGAGGMTSMIKMFIRR